MSKAPEGVRYQTDWEDGGCASTSRLVCSCGTDLLEGHSEHIASEDETIECPNCSKKYQFVWVGMVLKEVTSD